MTYTQGIEENKSTCCLLTHSSGGSIDDEELHVAGELSGRKADVDGRLLLVSRQNPHLDASLAQICYGLGDALCNNNTGWWGCVTGSHGNTIIHTHTHAWITHTT